MSRKKGSANRIETPDSQIIRNNMEHGCLVRALVEWDGDHAFWKVTVWICMIAYSSTTEATGRSLVLLPCPTGSRVIRPTRSIKTRDTRTMIRTAEMSLHECSERLRLGHGEPLLITTPRGILSNRTFTYQHYVLVKALVKILYQVESEDLLELGDEIGPRLRGTIETLDELAALKLCR